MRSETTAVAAPPRDELGTYPRVLGDELRRLRERRNWTRRDLKARLASDISLQTLASYESGTRQCPLLRLVEICLALGEPPHELLSRVHRRVFEPVRGAGHPLRVDLRTIVADGRDALSPLRRWAARRLEGAGAPVVNLDPTAVRWLACLCGIDAGELAEMLISPSDKHAGD